ncbi:MAG: Asp-tRNA(Asn)/Glu-tRNA(Gln) amidotransferase subunit GatB [Patescibacteria group bacterium]|nr:Asp-tRNA(Asn)/Glu-tRNA(Gln) amidotransferase subunit GatB [Patescibacteria group bacterium]
MNKYETVVGLEIHAHLSTESKMFCSCATSPKGKEYEAGKKDEPNVRVCPVCTGQPGTLPVANKKAIEDTILLGLALGSTIPPRFNFERKNYYYPDLPKAYQITSATSPPVVGGGLEIDNDGKTKFVELDHIHLEEDAGKLTHPKSGDYSLVDLNRAGTPLLEIITTPCLSSGVEAAEFMRNLQSILRYLGISDADMEKGQMRCDANISVRKLGAKELGAKVEVKNINSFKMVAGAIDYEAERQIEELESGNKIEQQTRGWNAARGKTIAQRSKEYANDYRYFPEPDIPPIEMGKGKEFDPTVINDRLPELPKEKKKRFQEEYGLSVQDAHTLSANYDLAKYFEETLEHLSQITESPDVARRLGKSTANYIINELLGKITDLDSIYESKITPESFAELIDLLDKGEITGKIAKDILPKMLENGKNPSEIVKKEGIKKVDDSAVEKIVDKVLADNPKEVERCRAGEVKLMGFFVGQVMKESRGQAEPGVANKVLKEKLS